MFKSCKEDNFWCWELRSSGTLNQRLFFKDAQIMQHCCVTAIADALYPQYPLQQNPRETHSGESSRSVLCNAWHFISQFFFLFTSPLLQLWLLMHHWSKDSGVIQGRGWVGLDWGYDWHLPYSTAFWWWSNSIYILTHTLGMQEASSANIPHCWLYNYFHLVQQTQGYHIAGEKRALIMFSEW